MPMIIILVLLIAGGVYLLSFLPESGGKRNETALDKLKMRYASGKISSEEFQRMKKDLD